MRLQQTKTGKRVRSDPGITFTRVRDAGRSDGSCGRGWRVEVRRREGEGGPLPLVDSRVLRTLAEATAWAREHWRPGWLWRYIDGLRDHPLESKVLDVVALAMQGDPLHFLMLLDALTEAGQEIDRARLTAAARDDKVFTSPLDETEAERAARRQRASLQARIEARHNHERNFSIRFGWVTYPRSMQLLIYYDGNPVAEDETFRPRFLDLARDRLRAEGIEELAREHYPPQGQPDAGYSVAVAYRVASAAQEARLREVHSQTCSELVEPRAG
jgi:hypothetical protein